MTTPAHSPELQERAVEPAPRRKTRTLWWLLGVLVIGLLLAAGVAVGIIRWQLLPRNEMHAVGSCRTYSSSQTMFRRGDWTLDPVRGEYSRPYSRLWNYPEPDGQPMKLISQAFAEAQGPDGVPYHGYLFDDLKTIGGKPIDFEIDYGMCATPARYGFTGLRTFAVSTNGTVWGKDLGKSEFVTDMPTNPRAAGWRIAE